MSFQMGVHTNWHAEKTEISMKLDERERERKRNIERKKRKEEKSYSSGPFETQA